MAKGIYFLASSGSTVVEYQTLDSEIKGLNNANIAGRENKTKALRTTRQTTLAQWLNCLLMILGLRVQILPLSLGERKWQEVIYFWATVVEWLTQYPDAKGSNPDTVIKRQKMTNMSLITCPTAIAQW